MPETLVKTRSSLKTTAAVIAAAIGISAAGFVISSLFSNSKTTTNLSLATPEVTSALTKKAIGQGTLAQLEPEETATFSRQGGGTYTVKFFGSVAAEQTNICFQAFPNRAHVVYNEYDSQGKVLDTQDLTIGPCDMGWAVEVLKVEAPIAPRAVLTVPHS